MVNYILKELEMDESIIKNDETSIRDCGLSLRTVNCLLRCSITTVGKLKNAGISKIASVQNVGKKTIQEIEDFLFSITNGEYSHNNSNSDTEKPLNSNDDITIGKTPLDERIYDIKIDELELPTNIYNILIKTGITTVGEFLEYGRQITITRKFIDIIYKQLEKYGIKNFTFYYPQKIETPTNYFLKIEDVFDDEWIINICQKYGYKNIGLLASINFYYVFIQDGTSIKETAYNKISIVEEKLKELGIEKAPVKLSYFQKLDLLKKDLKELSKINYINEILKILSNAIIQDNNILTPEQIKYKISPRELEIIHRRYGIGCPKESLEQIGNFYGCTKERIRQLETKALKKIANLIQNSFKNINTEIEELLDEFGSIIYSSTPQNQLSSSFVNDILSIVTNKCFEIDFGHNWIVKKGFNISEFEKNILNNISNVQKSTYSYEQIDNNYNNELKKYLKEDTMYAQDNYKKIYSTLFDKFLETNFVNLEDDLYEFAAQEGNRQKRDRDKKLFHLFKEYYPNGVHLPLEKEKKDILKQNLKVLYDKCSGIENLDPRYIANTLINHKDTIWIGRGYYNNINNIHIDWDVVDFAISEVIKRFDSGINKIKPYAIFEEYKDKFINANITNEIALVSLIKFRNNPRIETHRVDIVDSQSTANNMQSLEILENFVAQFPDGAPKSEIIHEMCEKRGIKPVQLDILYSDSNVLYRDNGIHYHIKNIHINNNKLDELIDLINKELDSNNSTFLHLRKMRNQYPATWVGVIDKDISPNFMARLLNLKHDKGFVIDNYIYAKKYTNSEQNITMLNILNNYVKEKSFENKYITMTEIVDFCEKQGLNTSRQLISDLIENFSIQYGQDTYIHNEILGYDKDFQQDVYTLVDKLKNDYKDKALPLISFDDVIQNYASYLPELNIGYDWNIYILRSVLSNIENIRVFDKIFIFNENMYNIEELDELAAYCITENFENGYCKLNELDKLLARLGITQYKNLHTYYSKLFFEGSSIKLVDNDTAVSVEKFAREKYNNV